MLFDDADKEMLRRMLGVVADFSGVEVLTYCVMSNHFHVLVRVPVQGVLSNGELMRRYKVLYPKPTKYQPASADVLSGILKRGGEDAEVIRSQLLARMGDVSAFMKTLKQRFSVWYNRTHDRFGTLWAERFKSVLVEGHGNALQTMAAYIDLNPVRAGLVDDPKDYRFCAYANAVAGNAVARSGLSFVWSDDEEEALRSHRLLLFGKGGLPGRGAAIPHEDALQVLEQGGILPVADVLRCRVRYFSDGAILGSAEFVRQLALSLNLARGRKRPIRVRGMLGADWQGLSVIRSLRRAVFE
jgi:REP element-mobilizing transposase RayT